MRNLLIITFLVLLPLFVFSQDKVSQYISNFQHIAVSEMNRSGIPASITLAQGMFESAYGESPSAVSYNNHFGIKCKKEWTGPYFYKHDDDRDKDGKLIPSCFRAYASVNESFEDHTNFLVERERYAELFSYSQTDYFNWAIGLERCGYATNSMYAERLIEIIERYELYQYDAPRQISPTLVLLKDNPEQSIELVPVATDAFSTITSASVPVAITRINVVNGEEKSTTNLAKTSKEDNTTTLIVLESFEEFSIISGSPVSNPQPPDLKKTKEKKLQSSTVSRVNRAIILPANYRRRSETSLADPKKMDRR